MAFQIYDLKGTTHSSSELQRGPHAVPCAYTSLVFKGHEEFKLSDSEVFLGAEMKIMFTKKNIAFTCVLKKNSNPAEEEDRKEIVRMDGDMEQPGRLAGGDVDQLQACELVQGSLPGHATRGWACTLMVPGAVS